MRMQVLAAVPLLFCGCLSRLVSRSAGRGGVVIAANVAGEPALAAARDASTGRSYFAWASLRGSGGPRFTLASAGKSGKAERVWSAAGGAGTVQSEPGLSLSSSSLYASWIENSSGTLSLKAAVYDLRGAEPPLEGVVSGLIGRIKNRVGITSSGKDSVFLSWEDFNPALRTPFAGVAEVGRGGVKWEKLLGNRAAEEEYMSPAIAPDGAGGVFAAFRHIHNGDRGIVLNHFSADGASWADDAQANAFLGYQSGPVLAPSPEGGLFLIWEDGRNGSIDIYGQKFSSGGAALWDPDGIPLEAADGNQWNPVIVPDAAGGFFCAWIDDDRGTNLQIEVQRIDKDGHPLWGRDGVAVSPSDSRQSDISMVTDGAGGVILAWNEPRYGYLDVFAQRLGPDGSLKWGNGGTAVTADKHDQVAPVMAPGGNGGALITWKRRRGRNSWEIRSQLLGPDGAAQWPAPPRVPGRPR